jgi:hypothetical protein
MFISALGAPASHSAVWAPGLLGSWAAAKASKVSSSKSTRPSNNILTVAGGDSQERLLTANSLLSAQSLETTCFESEREASIIRKS